jgi:hypothetical protein
MKRSILFAFGGSVLLFLAGCMATRSISDSGFDRDYSYRGEIREIDLVGSRNETNISESDITEALKSAPVPSKLPRGAKVLVIQSGASTPDENFLAEINQSIIAVPFSGVPDGNKSTLSKALRLTAARGGIAHILCYWGVLESAKRDISGKVVSWIPVAGLFVPDEKQEMRIRLRAIIIDVPTGRWTMVTPPPFEDTASSAAVIRKSSDQKQVDRLKRSAYHELAQTLVSDK